MTDNNVVIVVMDVSLDASLVQPDNVEPNSVALLATRRVLMEDAVLHTGMLF